MNHLHFNEVAAGRLLVAKPGLMTALSGCAGSVILLLRHDDQFTLGVDLTKPHQEISYGTFLQGNPDMNVLDSRAEQDRVLLCGGPVANGYPWPVTKEDGTIVFERKIDVIFLHNSVSGLPNAHKVGNAEFASYSYTALKDSFDDYKVCKPENCFVVFGYTGWSPGQLADEIDAGFWATIPATEDLVFGTIRDRLWDVCADKAKIDKSPPPFPKFEP